MERELKDKDEKMNKIKAVAIKAKKELDISKREVECSLMSSMGFIFYCNKTISRKPKHVHSF